MSARLEPKVREAVMVRDGYRCCHCGTRADTVQHRANKQSGGSKYRDGMSNLVAMCWASNVHMEASGPAAETARANGWKLSQYQTAADEPFYDYADDAWYLVDDEGGKNQVPAPVPA